MGGGTERERKRERGDGERGDGEKERGREEREILIIYLPRGATLIVHSPSITDI